MYSAIRVILGLLVFGIFVLIIRKNRAIRHPFFYIIGALLSVVGMLVLYFVPFENWFLTFRSPETAYRYTAFGRANIIHKIDGNESTFMIDRPGDTDTHLIIPKSEDGWKIGLGSDTECVYRDSVEDKTITIYRYKNSHDYYLFVQTINAENAEVQDSRNSDFFKMESDNGHFATYCTYLPNPDSRYWLSIHDVQIMPFAVTGTVNHSEDLNEQTISGDTSITLSSELPKEYASVLDRYREIVLIMTSDEAAGVYEGTIELPCPDGVEFAGWNSGILEWGSVHDRYGYILKDINGDDVPELFWVQEGYDILLAFTISDGEAVGLFSSRPKERMMVLDSGKLLQHKSGDADSGVYTVLTLPPNSDRLVVEEVVSYDCYFDDAGTEAREYSRLSWDGTLHYLDLEEKDIDLTKKAMTEEEYRIFREQYPSVLSEPTESWKQNEIYYFR